MQRPLAILTGLALATGALVLGATPADARQPDAAQSRTIGAAPKGKVSAARLLSGLPVRTETHSASYERSRFGGWIDRDRDGQNTRSEVLQSESTRTASLNRYGTVKGGKWVSAYDNKVFTNASRMDVDHMVPLAEAWSSGAWKWSAKRRTAFANDLGYGSSLIAVSLSSNRSKGDRDPAGWVPSASSDVCTYVKQFIAVKSRWRLSIDRAEKTAVLDHLASCANPFINRPAKPVVAALLPKVAPKPVPAPKPVTHAPSGGGSASAYYANCTAVRNAGAAPLHRGEPGYETPRLDRDGDGVACE